LTKTSGETRLKSKKEYYMAKGTIRRLMDRGFGFIQTEQAGDLFFHRNELEGVEFSSLREGQEVEFEKGQGRDGRPCAVKVKLAGTENSQAEAEADSTDTEGGGESEGDETA
jgi:CspA family cold shock protein